MTAATKIAPGERSDAHTGARNPSLDRKAGTVTHIMPRLGAFWRQRHAARIEDARRLVRLEVEVHALHAQVAADSLVLGTTMAPEPTYGPPAGHPEAEQLPLGAQDDVMLAGWSLDLWPEGEFEQITADGEQR